MRSNSQQQRRASVSSVASAPAAFSRHRRRSSAALRRSSSSSRAGTPRPRSGSVVSTYGAILSNSRLQLRRASEELVAQIRRTSHDGGGGISRHTTARKLSTARPAARRRKGVDLSLSGETTHRRRKGKKKRGKKRRHRLMRRKLKRKRKKQFLLEELMEEEAPRPLQ